MLVQPLLLKKCRWMGSYHLGYLEGSVFLSRCLGDLGAPYMASLVAQRLKCLPPLWETRVGFVQSLGWEDPLEEGIATHSSILAWRIPWTEEPGGLQSMGSQRVRHF